MPDSLQITQTDIDATWQFMLAAAPQLMTQPFDMLDGQTLIYLAQAVLKARLELVAMLGKTCTCAQPRSQEAQ